MGFMARLRIISQFIPSINLTMTVSDPSKTGKMKEFVKKNTPVIMALAIMVLPSVAFSSTTGEQFQGVYNFIHGAATGYLGRAISLAGGLIGLGMGASMGKAMPAISGAVLAVFGTLGPTIIDSLFASATV